MSKARIVNLRFAAISTPLPKTDPRLANPEQSESQSQISDVVGLFWNRFTHQISLVENPVPVANPSCFFFYLPLIQTEIHADFSIVPQLIWPDPCSVLPFPCPPVLLRLYTVIRPSRAEVISFVLYSGGITLCRSAAADTQLPTRVRRFCFNPFFLLLFCCACVLLGANKKKWGRGVFVDRRYVVLDQ